MPAIKSDNKSFIRDYQTFPEVDHLINVVHRPSVHEDHDNYA